MNLSCWHDDRFGMDFACGAVVDMVSAVPLTCIVDDKRRGVEQLGSSLGS